MACAALVTLLCGCASEPRPVLYPNAHYKGVGKARAEGDIDAALKEARDYGLTAEVDAKGGAVGAAKGGTTGAASGAAKGAAYGAFYGGAGIGAAAGAAGGAAGGVAGSLAGWLFQAKKENPAFRGYVERKLKEMGYEPIGWK